ncbi:MAG: gas vesicle protein [Chloroflexota bacterium]|nr:gas vesicle protein [Chloroflexota bacterium]MDE3192670.1 gas vesicle protein [Chloroflexota bacterium]
MAVDRRTFQQPATSIIDILDRVLDKGLVIAGDISVSLANVELLTIRIRLLVCSIDKAEQIGLNWWRYDRNLVAPAAADAVAGDGVGALEERIATLERRLATPPARKSTTKRSRNR